MQKKLDQKIRALPKKPGVYIFKDAAGFILYVGKAVNLRNRVRSYFARSSDRASGRMTGRIELMIPQIVDLDFTVTDNELESLILENNFIKQLRPKYNVLLRDDKNYLFLKINMKDEIPTIGFDRKPNDKNARYFGPYTSSLEIKNTLRLVRKIFPYCANSKIGSKPCFYYHIGKCPGVCFGKISLEEYKGNYIKNVAKFLEGKRSEILHELQRQMKSSAAKKQFEQAAKIRDQIFSLNRVLERQKIIYPKKIDQDIFSLFQNGVTSVNLFMIREGKLVRKENFILENTKGMNAAEILREFLPKYYSEATDKPKKVLLPVHPALDAGSGQSKIPASAGMVEVPTRGPKLQLIKLGQENARQYLESISDKKLLEEARLLASLKELQRVLNLPELPGRIEAYDISNIQGSNPVGSMIVFDFARPKKADYRKFKINKNPPAGGPDDFAMMREMLERRFKNDWPKPDLILIDGGKGQLNAAIAALKMTNPKSQIPIIALAKRLEEVFLPGRKNSVVLPSNSIALFLLQRIRDEAHRFAVKYHRALRSKGSLASILDSIPGIGPARKKLLLQKYGSTAGIRQAATSELTNTIGKKFAEKIKASL